jgi:hypothetical protein
MSVVIVDCESAVEGIKHFTLLTGPYRNVYRVVSEVFFAVGDTKARVSAAGDWPDTCDEFLRAVEGM